MAEAAIAQAAEERRRWRPVQPPARPQTPLRNIKTFHTALNAG